ncbi:hypothetical protein BJ322DRAFT_360406 [Thelephora terrestris]|uniref:C2H2-type domain-containing protein n=1 Tax=Thelephora terrestris TaxID=56493 RepID=A0A9P6H4W9_9AGAM|nr:hypothetical protein BJ322DRAFT_360406 [Thelephora terrestris]
MARRVKKERNIHCTTCGRTYADPIAAQNHARKHPEIQQATASLTVSTADTDAEHPLSPSRRAPPNLSKDVSESFKDITPEVPQVAASPVAMMKSETVSKGPGKLFCQWCPHLENFTAEENLRRHTRRHHPNVYKCTRCQVEMPGKDEMWKHMVDLHGAKHRERVLKKLHKCPANDTAGRKQSIPNAKSTVSSYVCLFIYAVFDHAGCNSLG